MAEISLANLLLFGGHVTLVVAGGAVLARALGLRDPAGRIVFWRLLLVLCLALPFVTTAPDPLTRPAGQASLAETVRAATSPSAHGPAVAVARRAARALPDVPSAAVVLALATGAVLRLLWLGAGVASLRRLRGTRAGMNASAAFAWAAARVGARARLRVSPDVALPATFGLFRPVVLVPPAFEAWPPLVQRALAAHELLHVRRGDWAHALAEEAGRSLLWFHPAAWWLLDRIRLAREQVVDREVVRLTGDRRGYLEALVELATAEPPAAPSAAAAFFRKPHLLERVAYLTKEVPMPRLRIAVSLAAASAAAIALTVAGVRAVPLEPARAAAPPQVASAVPAATAVGGGALPPAPVHRAPVAYPAAARAAGLAGPVVLQVSTDPTGTPTSVEPLLGAAELTEAAVGALWQWRFEPGAEPATFLLAVNVRPDEPEPAAGVESRRVGGSLRPPAKAVDVRPTYPPDARKERVQGVVIVEATIDVDGAVAVGRVLRSADQRLDAAALDAVLRWQFVPTVIDGVRHPIVMTVTVNFTLS